jgi:2,4-dienoyl-CoA reductase-like NADH-dependent reductase (Old Yellow Enzyme family)
VSTAAYLEPGRIGRLELPNRIVRAGTSETMAGPDGEVTDELVALYERLAAGGVGLIFSGHLYCERRGRYARRQAGIHSDALIPSLKRLTTAVHAHGGRRVFAQLAHAGSQSRIPGNDDMLAPSPVPNALTGREVAGASEERIEEVVRAFGAAARRAAEAGFDGVHVHGANGYLISEFSSPLANHRSDRFGGSPEARDRFLLEVLGAMRRELPSELPLTLKLGFADAPPGGLQPEEAVARAGRAVDAGVDAIEVSVNVMTRPTDSARAYVAVDRRRAATDLLPQRLMRPPEPEAYFLPWAEALRARVDTRIVLVGGMRTTATIETLLRERKADFVAMARPLIREPDLVAQLAAGRTGRFDCTSCNLCLAHEGHHSLRCWRTPRRRLVEHAVYRLRGGLKRMPPSA